MKVIHGFMVPACVVGIMLAAGCATGDRDALHQPMEVNYADPADPMERAFEDDQALDARGRAEAPVQTVPDADDEPPPIPDPRGPVDD